MSVLALDVHAASFTLEHMTPGGRVARQVTRKTTAKDLIEVIQNVRGPKVLVVEECHLAQWVKDTVERYVDRLVICDPQRNAWIAKDQFNDDSSSAHKLALLYRGGFIKEIKHPDQGGAQLRSLFLHYYDLTQQLTRFKNKLKATFRQQAIVSAGKTIYEPENHRLWLAKLGEQPHLRHVAAQRFGIVDLLSEQRDVTTEKMVRIAQRHKVFDLIDGMPGAGPVLTTGYLALIGDARRFSRENKLWKYGGFSNVEHSSDEVTYQEHASPAGCHALKWVVMEHFMHAVEHCQQSNRFKRQYAELRARGLADAGAHRHVCRALLSVVRAIWTKEEPYRDELAS